MSRLPEHVIDDIRSRVDIVDVVSGYVRLKRSGRGFLGLCPFHTEKTPSFHVDPERQFFYCFGCQTGGNVFHFLMKIDNAPFIDVVRRLAERAGVVLHEEEASPEEARRRRMREAIVKANEIAADYYVRTLFSKEGEAARAYLKERGLTEEAVRTFRIGFAPGGWHRLEQHLAEKGVPPAVGAAAGLLGKGKRGVYDWLRERITFPIIDLRGRVVGFGGRALPGTDEVKYLNTAESPVFSKRRHLYGLHIAAREISRTGRAVIVEGYMDVVGLYASGYRAAVASLGTAFTAEQARLLRRYASEAVLAYDADGAGRTATRRGLEVLASEGLEVRVARLPGGHDPDSYVREEGLEAFVRAVDTSAALIEYTLDEALNGIDLSTVEGRVRAVEAAIPILQGIESAVAREGYLARTAARIGVTEAALAEELARRTGRGRTRTPSRYNLTTRRYTSKDLPPTGGGRTMAAAGIAGSERSDISAERDLAASILYEPGRAEEVARRLGDEPFTLQEYNNLFRWILSQGEKAATGETLIGRISDPELARLAGALLVGGRRPAAALEVYMGRVEEEHIRRRVNELEAKLSLLMKDDDMSPEEVGRIVGAYKQLRDRLHTLVGRDKAS